MFPYPELPKTLYPLHVLAQNVTTWHVRVVCFIHGLIIIIAGTNKYKHEKIGAFEFGIQFSVPLKRHVRDSTVIPPKDIVCLFRNL